MNPTISDEAAAVAALEFNDEYGRNIGASDSTKPAGCHVQQLLDRKVAEAVAEVTKRCNALELPVTGKETDFEKLVNERDQLQAENKALRLVIEEAAKNMAEKDAEIANKDMRINILLGARDRYADEAKTSGDYILKLSRLLGCSDGDDTPEKRIEALQASCAAKTEALRRIGEISGTPTHSYEPCLEAKIAILNITHSALADTSGSELLERLRSYEEKMSFVDELRNECERLAAERDDLKEKLRVAEAASNAWQKLHDSLMESHNAANKRLMEVSGKLRRAEEERDAFKADWSAVFKDAQELGAQSVEQKLQITELKAEVERLTKRVAKLEAEINAPPDPDIFEIENRNKAAKSLEG